MSNLRSMWQLQLPCASRAADGCALYRRAATAAGCAGYLFIITYCTVSKSSFVNVSFVQSAHKLRKNEFFESSKMSAQYA
jgi:hypothetical protein